MRPIKNIHQKKYTKISRNRRYPIVPSPARYIQFNYGQLLDFRYPQNRRICDKIYFLHLFIVFIDFLN